MRHREFQRPLRILLNQIKQRMAALLCQLNALLEIRTSNHLAFRPAAEFLKYGFGDRFTETKICPLGQL